MIASVRATDWHILTAPDLQSFAAAVRLAREWIVESAVYAPIRRELDIESRSILSLSRRKSLLDGVDHHDWPAVWQALSISDLHFLGDELLERAPKELWTNPALNAMKEAAGHAKELDMLGSVAPSLNGTPQPRLRRYEPYEEYQRYFYPDRLAQRLSELKLYLAWMAEGAAWPPETLADLAAPAAEVFLSKVQMHETWDWVAVLGSLPRTHHTKLRTIVEAMKQLSLFALCAALLVPAQDVSFKDELKLIEIYATVFDHSGHPVAGLKQEQFEIRDDGTLQPIRVFETTEQAISCALLLDTTGSMTDSIPALRNAAREFIGALRQEDSIGIDKFSEHLDELAEISTDKAVSSRACVPLDVPPCSIPSTNWHR